MDKVILEYYDFYIQWRQAGLSHWGACAMIEGAFTVGMDSMIGVMSDNLYNYAGSALNDLRAKFPILEKMWFEEQYTKPLSPGDEIPMPKMSDFIPPRDSSSQKLADEIEQIRPPTDEVASLVTSLRNHILHTIDAHDDDRESFRLCECKRGHRIGCKYQAATLFAEKAGEYLGINRK